ncbi:TetR/AcrR family transcriptional regulator [bacterium]|nr:TetR/AcrR family transcriptional regulator [bacterium]
MPENSSKAQQILITAKDLFYRYGFKRVSIEEVCREAGVSKMTFYKYFKNKNGLIIHMMNTLSRDAWEIYESIMSRQIPYKEKVAGMLRLKADSTKGLSPELLQEIHNSDDEELKAYFQKHTITNLKRIMKDLTKAQQDGELRQDMKIGFILYFMNHMFEMAKDQQLTALYATPQDLIMELNNFFFYGILPRE